MMISRHLVFVSLFLGAEIIGLGQTTQQPTERILGQINIASPNAASLGKFGDIPVSYHTGIPSIDIPLYTLKEGNLSVPISLSYHAGGLKVDEQSSSVGAGWALNAGGVISRTVKDKPDERQTSSLSQQKGYFSDYGLNLYDPNLGANNGEFPQVDNDLEPDLFFFNFSGYSGKFYFGDDRTPFLVPEQDLKIEYDYPGDYDSGTWENSPGMWGGTGYCIMSFTITTPDGTKYYFGASTAVTGQNCDPIEVISNFTLNSGSSYSQVISSWYLQKIVSSDGNSVITFNYTRDLFATYAFTNPPHGIGFPSTDYSVVKNYVAGVQVANIQSSSVVVTFTPGTQARKDLSGWSRTDVLGLADNVNSTSYPLGGINIKKIADGTCIKQFVLSQDYFQDTTTPLPAIFSTIPPGLTYDTYRLRLNYIQEISCDGSAAVPPYTFTYFQEPVPRLFSLGRDNWGFYNGVSTNVNLFPALTLDNNSVTGTPAADRNSYWPAMRCGALQMITYPTGGNTTFDFEPNLFTLNTTINGQPVQTDATVGGLRIKTINNNDPVSGNTVTTNYSYTTQGSTLSSGILFSQPTYIQLNRNDWVGITNAFNNGSSGCAWNFSDPSSIQYAYSDNPLRPMNTTQGNHIGYSQVSVSQTGNGYSKYKYYGTDVNHNYLAITSINSPAFCDPSIPNYPPAPVPTDFMRGELSYEGHYNNSGVILNEKFYTPSFAGDLITTPGRVVGANGGETLYELTTSYKVQETEIENNYQLNGTFQSKQSQTYYESSYHHQPTRIITSTSDDRTVENRIKYAFDFRVIGFDTISDCTGKYLSSRYLNYSNNVLGNPDNDQGKSLQQQFALTYGYTDPAFGIIAEAYFSAMNTDRKEFSDSRVAKFTNPIGARIYQTSHDNTKASADSELGSLLWAQDVYINSPIEITEWINGNLVSASYTLYSDDSGDSFGVYPKKTMKIDLASLANTFTPATTSADGKSIVKDNRYSDESSFSFLDGHPINVLNRDGVASSFDWGYNTYPTVKAINASNNAVETSQQQTVSKSISTTSQSVNNPYSFMISQAGTIEVSIPNSAPPSYNLNTQYIITGTGNTNISSTLCSGTPCNSLPSSASYSNLPPGQYNLNFANSSSFTSSPFTTSFNISYPGTVTSLTGTKEFFYDGFEENADSRVITGVSHTGKKYWNASYTTTYSPPNTRNYIIQWWNLSNGTWQPNRQIYTNNMTLNGPVDDVRIFPSDAQLSTFTYEPGIGMTSKTDTNQISVFYEYDGFSRLKTVRDNDGKILQTFDYHYQNQGNQ